jgi:hypothetical protein
MMVLYHAKEKAMTVAGGCFRGSGSVSKLSDHYGNKRISGALGFEEQKIAE